MSEVTRRTAVKLGVAAIAAGQMKSSSAAPRDARVVLEPARYQDVTLHDGPMLEQFKGQHQTLMAMDDDALLKPFRQAAGLPTPGDDLGGWYNAVPGAAVPADFHGYIPGHSFGQYVSSLSRAYAITGDGATREKVHRLVDRFAPTISPKFYEDYPLPAYTFDKTNIGLLDAYTFAGKADALKVFNNAVDVALPYLPERALTREEMEARPHKLVANTWDEPYTLPENLYLAWKRGAGSRYRALAARYLQDKAFFDPLAAGKNVLPHLHAYSHVNALSSAMQAWLVEGSSRHLQAAKNGFDFVVAQSFATGGWGPNESFVEPGSGGLGDSLNKTHAGFETPCGSYGHFKAARYLMCTTGESRYGDSMERVLYNTILGALPMKADGTAFYYSDYNTIGGKFYHDHKCSCCSGTIGQIVADYWISTYFSSPRGVAVNLYTPSEFRWRTEGRTVAIRQTTAYPLDNHIELEISTATPERFALSLRIPAWSGNGTRIEVNGKSVASAIIPGRFFDIKREWRGGDRVALSLDMPLRLEAVDDKNPHSVAVMQGPLALFAVGNRFLPFRQGELLAVRQTAPRSAEWRITTPDGIQVFKPYFAISSELHRLYQQVSA